MAVGVTCASHPLPGLAQAGKEAWVLLPVIQGETWAALISCIRRWLALTTLPPWT